MALRVITVGIVLSVVCACDPQAQGEDPADPSLPILGGDAHDLSALLVEELLTADDGLALPRDLALHPEDPAQLWVINRRDDSMVIAFDIDGEKRVEKRAAFGNTHFMPEPSAFAFGNGTLATAHEEDQPTQGEQTPADFMGPSLWDSDEANFDAGHATHLDMLHNSPRAMGIAWEKDNAYWVFDGAHDALTRYDFQHDHGYAGADHSDGVIARYVEGEVEAVPDVPSHMDLDRETGLLYVADTGNSRIAVLDIATGERGSFVSPNYDGGDQYRCDGASLTTLADREAFLRKPTGIALHDGRLFVSDFETGEIQAFGLDGEWLGYLDTGLRDSIMGIAFDPSGRLYVTDSASEKVLRLTAR